MVEVATQIKEKKEAKDEKEAWLAEVSKKH